MNKIEQEIEVLKDAIGIKTQIIDKTKALNLEKEEVLRLRKLNHALNKEHKEVIKETKKLNVKLNHPILTKLNELRIKRKERKWE